MQNVQIPRLTLPGIEVDEEGRELVQALIAEHDAQEAHRRAQQKGLAAAMVRLGKPIFRAGKPKRKRPTKHVRHMSRIAARSRKAVA